MYFARAFLKRLAINLFEKQNHIELAKLIKDLYSSKNDKREKDFINFNLEAVKRFSWKNIAKDYFELFQVINHQN